MSRCLCPGRILRIGRGPVSPRPLHLSHPSVSRIHTRLASTNRRPITHDEYSLLLSYNDLPPRPLESWRKFNPDAWISILAKFMRPTREAERQGASLLEYKDDLSRSHALMGYLLLARTHSNLDLLAHLGFNLKQWSTVHALLSQLIDTYEILLPYIPPQNSLQGLDWNSDGLSLDQLADGETPSKGFRIKPLPASDPIGLDFLTLRPAARGFAQRHLCQVLLSLGTLILKAADSPQTDANLAMSCVYRILARLHHLDLIPDRVYQYPKNDPSQVSFRPPGLNLLSSHIMSVLSDAAWVEHEAALANAANEAGELPPFLPFKVGVRELGPEVWLEFILWCCVEHGFAKQGAWLLREMTQRTGNEAWKIESWQPLIQALDLVQQTNISTETSWRRPSDDQPPKVFKGRNKPPFNGLGKRTISTEVVVSLRSSLANKAYTGIGFHGLSPTDILRFSSFMNSLLDPSGNGNDLRPTNKTTNWHILRILQSGGLQPYQDPLSFEKTLRSTHNVVPPWDGEAVISEEYLSKITRSQVYDESAAIAGLVEYNVKAYSHQRLAGRAFHQYAWLQNIVDASKAYHIQAFFEHLSRSKTADVPFFNSQQLGAADHQSSSLPQVSTATLAELLDLATVNRAFDFGNWLLFNDDVDGPSIPVSAYRNQVLAPSILRFAAATQNAKLSEKVISSLEMPLSVNMLKALVNTHFHMEDWDRAIVTLQYLRDFRLKSWGFSNITALAAKIIRLDATIKDIESGGDVLAEKERQSLERAKDILLRFFRMEFNTPASKNRRVTNFQQKVLMRLLPILKSLPSPLSDITKQINMHLKPASHVKLHYLPSVSFHTLLSAVMDVHGSTAGIELWLRWCLNPPSPTHKRQREGGIVRLFNRSELASPRWSRGDPGFDPKWTAWVQRKAVIPNLNTIRLISQAAMKEYELDQVKSDPTQPHSAHHPLQYPSRRLPAFAYARPYRAMLPHNLYSAISKTGGSPPTTAPVAALDFCVSMFLRAGLTEDQIGLEVPGHLQRMRSRNIFAGLGRRARTQLQNTKKDPWMEASP
ncbi:hypothetical protein N7462_006492 [Penicillium macrosclerotiorum]|uniref:uncharacterized protein n=1 Tax=Penicillium macrosclerotiorum TaxID=303699 RepID=UPI002547633F|nr:uncharacterized protein N7462_006492 [Penicillium macrosclerotiorum]KAJ5683327.1 hypothetical protein N7462_006492 [Penicillium macrosclerotiorum]